MQDDQYHKGLATRRQVMGDPFVDRALASTTAFTQPIQDHISRNAWGDVWQRDGPGPQDAQPDHGGHVDRAGQAA